MAMSGPGTLVPLNRSLMRIGSSLIAQPRDSGAAPSRIRRAENSEGACLRPESLRKSANSSPAQRPEKIRLWSIFTTFYHSDSLKSTENHLKFTVKLTEGKFLQGAGWYYIRSCTSTGSLITGVYPLIPPYIP